MHNAPRGRTPDVRACFRAVLHRRGSANGVPPTGLIPYRPKRATPYLYSEEEIRGLMDAAQLLPRAAVYGLNLSLPLRSAHVTGLRSAKPRTHP